jgi:pterin-4a-carbinolamine dehydratase
MKLMELEVIKRNLFENKNDTSIIFGKNTTIGAGSELPIEAVEYDWEVKNNSLNKTFYFLNARRTIEFVQKMYVKMERMQHHCVFSVNDCEVTVSLQTKVVNDITGQDKLLQKFLDELYYDIEGLDISIDYIGD